MGFLQQSCPVATPMSRARNSLNRHWVSPASCIIRKALTASERVDRAHRIDPELPRGITFSSILRQKTSVPNSATRRRSRRHFNVDSASGSAAAPLSARFPRDSQLKVGNWEGGLRVRAIEGLLALILLLRESHLTIIGVLL